MTDSQLELSRRSLLLALGAGTVLAITPSWATADPRSQPQVTALPSQASIPGPSGTLTTVPKLLGFHLTTGASSTSVSAHITFNPEIYRLYPSLLCRDADGRQYRLDVLAQSAESITVRVGTDLPANKKVTIILGGLRIFDCDADTPPVPAYLITGASGDATTKSLASSQGACHVSLAASWTPGKPGELRSPTAIFLTARGTQAIPAQTQLWIEMDARYFDLIKVIAHDFRSGQKKIHGGSQRQDFRLTSELIPGTTTCLKILTKHLTRQTASINPTVISMCPPKESITFIGTEAIIDQGCYPEMM